jgi:hypothetical protein
MDKKRMYWRICIALVILLGLLQYTPLFTPQGVFKPGLVGIPFTLWTSFLITAALVALTYIGSRVHPGSDEEEGSI